MKTNYQYIIYILICCILIPFLGVQCDRPSYNDILLGRGYKTEDYVAHDATPSEIYRLTTKYDKDKVVALYEYLYYQTGRTSLQVFANKLNDRLYLKGVYRQIKKNVCCFGFPLTYKGFERDLYVDNTLDIWRRENKKDEIIGDVSLILIIGLIITMVFGGLIYDKLEDIRHKRWYNKTNVKRQLLTSPTKNNPLTIEEYNSISPKKISEESLIKYKNKEGVEKKADNIVGLIVIILSILIGCWISNKVADPINEVSGALLTAWIMGAAFLSFLAFCILGTITFYIFKIDKIVEKIIYKRMYAAEIEYYEILRIRDLDNKNKQFEK